MKKAKTPAKRKSSARGNGTAKTDPLTPGRARALLEASDLDDVTKCRQAILAAGEKYGCVVFAMTVGQPSLEAKVLVQKKAQVQE